MQGVNIYSGDADFNNQIREKKIILKGVEANDIISDKLNQIITLNSTETVTKTESFNDETVISEQKKHKEALEKITEKIEENIAAQNAALHIQILTKPSSQNFFTVNNAGKTYFVPVFHDYGKSIYSEESYFSVNRSLDFLHTQKFSNYSSKSLGYCFYEAFSVRPPPVLA